MENLRKLTKVAEFDSSAQKRMRSKVNNITIPPNLLLPGGRKFCKITQKGPLKISFSRGILLAVRHPILAKRGRKGAGTHFLTIFIFSGAVWKKVDFQTGKPWLELATVPGPIWRSLLLPYPFKGGRAIERRRERETEQQCSDMSVCTSEAATLLLL